METLVDTFVIFYILRSYALILRSVDNSKYTIICNVLIQQHPEVLDRFVYMTGDLHTIYNSNCE